ncbi:hypothetical protein F8568_023550 [Actinomadura sp. LD22]|uniref:Transposase n=1 Tax=Actinomadura physcomitrii TaxID=2650748 RepID=A0A6I4MKR3_9ACTN|nr:hypothetical protein [Actinomadura physcomitrii]
MPRPPAWTGRRGKECFHASKNEVGLDYHPVRKHTAWYRHVTLAMVAHAHLAFLAADPPARFAGQPPGLVKIA